MYRFKEKYHPVYSTKRKEQHLTNIKVYFFSNYSNKLIVKYHDLIFLFFFKSETSRNFHGNVR